MFRDSPKKLTGSLIRYLVAEWIHFTPFWDKSTHYKTESVNFLGLMNSATRYMFWYRTKP